MCPLATLTALCLPSCVHPYSYPYPKPSVACAHSLHGTCVHTLASNDPNSHGCDCDKGWQGLACEKTAGLTTSTCFNNCSARGACVEGGCVCGRGYHGLGCAFHVSRASVVPRASEGKVGAIWHPANSGQVKPSRVKSSQMSRAEPAELRVYVYDLPRIVTARRIYASDIDRQVRLETGLGMRLDWT